jgi:diguanylate cyclase (GGDEF)-like protein
MKTLNETKGRPYGDSAIRWMGILLQEECSSEVYRIGGIEFAVLLKFGAHEEHSEMIERILGRIKREAGLLGFPDSAADIALVFFDQSPTSFDTLLMILGEAMVRVKNKEDSHFMHFSVTDFNIPAQSPTRWKSNSDSDISFAIRWISLINIHQVLELGRILDEAQQEAYTDTISGLPNLKAALRNLEKSIEDSMTSHQPFSVLMIDGDNIRAYNSINYAAGDEMIRNMCIIYKESIRPNDFVARWRSGDEFLVILPDTSTAGAKIIGERIRLAIKEASKDWRFPVTVSIGVASYPIHGDNLNTLIDTVESANKRAKDQGKDQVVLAY